jgi:hypothetical protein
MAERSTGDTRSSGREAAVEPHGVDEARPGEEATPVELVDEIPDEHDLRDEAAPSSLPEAERPTAHQGPSGDGTIVGGVDAVGAPAYDTVPDLAGTDPTAMDPQLEAILNAEDTSGGLDGRNDAQLDTGGPTDPNAEAPAGGLEGAAGKANARQQDVLDAFKEKAFEAAEKGDYGTADKIAEQANQFMIDEGIKEAPAETTTGAGTELITGFTSLGGGPKQVWDPEKGEVVQVDGTSESGGTVYGSEATQMNQSGTAASGDGGEGTKPSTTTGANEDRTEDSGGLPDHLRDPSAGIDDEHEAIRWESELGGDVDPHPEADHTAFVGEINAGSAEDYTAEYEEGHVEPDPADAAAPDPNLDWEFMEGG